MNNDIQIDYAEKSLRFVNLLIDNVCFWALFIAHVFIFESWMSIINTHKSFIFNFAYFHFLYAAYYFVFEALFGKSPAKFLTGTKVVDYDGNKPSVKRILIRSACRLIPFEALSFLFSTNGWHDSISKTFVVHK